SANEVTIDTKPPVIQLHEVSSNTTVVNPSSPDNQLLVVSTRRPTFTGVADANSTVKLTFYSDPVTCTTTAADDSTWSCTPASDIPPGNHTFEVTATDQAGNVTALPAINLVVWSGVLETEIVDTKVITKTETSATKDSSQSSQDKDDSESDTSTDTSATSENTYDVIVKIVDDKGNPLPFTKVTLFSKPREAITDKDGIAHFKDVEAGEHTIVVANNNQVGQQKITIGGKDVERYEYTIEIKETNPFLNPWVAMTIGMLVSIIIVAVTLFIREKYKK
ncbi:MAG: hypothetical protein QG593_91, partial [Patescibacteria group bacterium]|nr:hypothetical protein [Patescibacteria group bacterium]